MRLLKIIVVFFIIHFIRRFIQMYKAVQELKQENDLMKKTRSQFSQPHQQNKSSVEVDFKVID